jgi:dipeptidase D
MTTAVQNILNIFEEINKVPRQSEKEEQIHQWLVDWAESNGFKYVTDESLNINIKIPATKGYEKAPLLVLQGHMDMVCEKIEGSSHDFDKDPIEHVIEGDWLRAKDTSLGADNGIAIAMSLAAALDKDLEHPALEILITSAEETGLYGANALKPGFVEGKILLNLDSEDEGIFTVGCAGGNDTLIHLPLEFEEIGDDLELYKLTVTGLLGGHSGMDINSNRESSNVLMTRLLSDVRMELEAHLVDLHGGTAHNSLARTTEAVVAVKKSEKKQLKRSIESIGEIFKIENSVVDKGLEIKLGSPDGSFEQMLTEESAVKAINLLLSIPHGVLRMSSAIEGLVQTSNNIAIVRVEEKNLFIHNSQRSSIMSDLNYASNRIEAAAQLSGAETEVIPKYPSWMPNMDSELLKRCKRVYTETFGKEPVIEAIHAGLECGVIGSIYEGMDMISFGPDIEGCHSPDEKMKLSSVELVWQYLGELFKSFKS